MSDDVAKEKRCRDCRHCKEMPAQLPDCKAAGRLELDIYQWADGPPPHWCPGFEEQPED